MKLVIVYTDKNDKLKRVEFKGQNIDNYYIQWYEIDGVKVSFVEAMKFIYNV